LIGTEQGFVGGLERDARRHGISFHGGGDDRAIGQPVRAIRPDIGAATAIPAAQRPLAGRERSQAPAGRGTAQE